MWLVKDSNEIEFTFARKPISSLLYDSINNRTLTRWHYPAYRVGEDEGPNEKEVSWYEEHLWDTYGVVARVEMPKGSMLKLLGFEPNINELYEI